MRHTIHNQLLTRKVKIHLVGVGGNGSQVLSGLARLHLSMLALDHPGGLDVTAFDSDTVSESNVGRQLFSPADVGINKAVVLVHRLNAYYGLNWKAAPTLYDKDGVREHCGYYNQPDIVITCVDSAKARREIHTLLDGMGRGSIYWLDMGNEATTGQVVFGETRPSGARKKRALDDTRLPVVTELFPELLNKNIPESDTPTCSLAEALDRQELFVCQTVATCALQMLWTLFRYGGLDFSAQFINLKSGVTSPLPIDPTAWERFFAKPGKKPASRKKLTSKQPVA